MRTSAAPAPGGLLSYMVRFRTAPYAGEEGRSTAPDFRVRPRLPRAVQDVLPGTGGVCTVGARCPVPATELSVARPAGRPVRPLVDGTLEVGTQLTECHLGPSRFVYRLGGRHEVWPVAHHTRDAATAQAPDNERPAPLGRPHQSDDRTFHTDVVQVLARGLLHVGNAPNFNRNGRPGKDDDASQRQQRKPLAHVDHDGTGGRGTAADNLQSGSPANWKTTRKFGSAEA
jgi:hypothetical protein